MMGYFSRLEKQFVKWFENLPRLPRETRDWLATNGWWLIIIFIAAIGVDAIGSLAAFAANVIPLGSSYVASYYGSATFIAFSATKMGLSFVFSAIEITLLALAIQPLRDRQKKGWVLVFAALLLHALAVVADAILTLNSFSFVVEIVFGVLWLGMLAYLLFEVRDEFSHVVVVKKAKHKKSKA